MTSTEEATAEQAPRPPAEAIEKWLPLVGGDEYGALLCATSDAAATAALDVSERAVNAMRPTLADAGAAQAARRVRNEARADVADYFGDTLADQHPAVIRAAGFRS